MAAFGSDNNKLQNRLSMIAAVSKQLTPFVMVMGLFGNNGMAGKLIFGLFP